MQAKASMPTHGQLGLEGAGGARWRGGGGRGQRDLHEVGLQQVLAGTDVHGIGEGQAARGLHLVHHRQQLCDLPHLVAPLFLAFLAFVALVLILHGSVQSDCLQEQ